MLDFVAVPACLDGAGIGTIHRRAIIRMYGFQKGFIGVVKFVRMKTEDAVDLIRPGQSVIEEIQLPAAEVCHLLCPVQALLTCLQPGVDLLYPILGIEGIFHEVEGSPAGGLQLLIGGPQFVGPSHDTLLQLFIGFHDLRRLGRHAPLQLGIQSPHRFLRLVTLNGVTDAPD